jgi:hypothetical protein
MATQEFLDATRAGSFSTPVEWDALADAWELSAFTAEQTAEWVGVEIEVPAVAVLLEARVIAPSDVSFITDFFSPSSLPDLQVAIAAIAVLRSLDAVGRSLSGPNRVQMLTLFFQGLADSGVTLALGPVP